MSGRDGAQRDLQGLPGPDARRSGEHVPDSAALSAPFRRRHTEFAGKPAREQAQLAIAECFGNPGDRMAPANSFVRAAAPEE